MTEYLIRYHIKTLVKSNRTLFWEKTLWYSYTVYKYEYIINYNRPVSCSFASNQQSYDITWGDLVGSFLAPASSHVPDVFLPLIVVSPVPSRSVVQRWDAWGGAWPPLPSLSQDPEWPFRIEKLKWNFTLEAARWGLFPVLAWRGALKKDTFKIKLNRKSHARVALFARSLCIL